MNLLFPELVTDADGVYQPLPPLWVSAVLLMGGVAAAVALTYGRGGPWFSTVVIIGLAIGFGLRTLLEQRRHGPKGQPLVRVAGGQVTLRRADKSNNARDFQLPLAQIAHLVIYGPTGHRAYRFIQHDGSWREAQPQWKPRAEALVIAFLQQRLRERVVVEEPQTGFAQARGDGPYFGS